MSQARPSYREYVAGLHGDAGPLQLLCRPLAAGSLVELWRFLLLGLEVELTRATGLSWAGWPAWARVLVNLLALAALAPPPRRWWWPWADPPANARSSRSPRMLFPGES